MSCRTAAFVQRLIFLCDLFAQTSILALVICSILALVICSPRRALCTRDGSEVTEVIGRALLECRELAWTPAGLLQFRHVSRGFASTMSAQNFEERSAGCPRVACSNPTEGTASSTSGGAAYLPLAAFAVLQEVLVSFVCAFLKRMFFFSTKKKYSRRAMLHEGGSCFI